MEITPEILSKTVVIRLKGNIIIKTRTALR